MLQLALRAPYLLFVGDETRPSYAKTARGIADWRPELCMGQLRRSSAALDMGLPDIGVVEAAANGAGSLIIGTALIGGSIPEKWIDTLAAAAHAGMDIVAGLHTRLDGIRALVEAANKGGGELIDVRTPPKHLPIGNGKPRTGKRLLTVGTDCALGKKYTALCLERDMRKAGLNVDFRASGQTGIMIAGSGIPIDCVVADFISGAAEALSPDNHDSHWDVIEGQGSIFHPGYAAVSHGLLIGSQPDAFVVCHKAGRSRISGWEHCPMPSVGEVIERTIALGKDRNADIRCVGIAVDTSALDEAARDAYTADLAARYALPCVDPMRDGTSAIIANL